MSETLSGLFGLVMAAMLTPGPNNILIFAVAIADGIGRAVVASTGIAAGMLVLLAFSWFGGAVIFETWQGLRLIVITAGTGYLAWLGLTMAFGSTTENGENLSAASFSPSSFWQLAAFQFANPKAWVLALAATSAVQTETPGLGGLATLSGVFTAASALSLSLWIVLGRLWVGPHKSAKMTPWLIRGLGLSLFATSAALLLSVLQGGV